MLGQLTLSLPAGMVRGTAGGTVAYAESSSSARLDPAGALCERIGYGGRARHHSLKCMRVSSHLGGVTYVPSGLSSLYYLCVSKAQSIISPRTCLPSDTQVTFLAVESRVETGRLCNEDDARRRSARFSRRAIIVSGNDTAKSTVELLPTWKRGVEKTMETAGFIRFFLFFRILFFAEGYTSLVPFFREFYNI